MLAELRSARDYNRALPGPVRWGHIVWAAQRGGARRVRAWVSGGKPAWARQALSGLVVVVLLLPFDRIVAEWARRLDTVLYGDADRVLRWLQEYGQGPSVVLAAVLVWQLDPVRRGRLLSWLVAMAGCWIAVFGTKLLIGRPRPKFDEPWLFLGPLGEYPLGPGLGVHHAWEFWTPSVRDSGGLWSMPSSHTAFAVLMTYFLAGLYPRLSGLLWGLAGVVGGCRVLYGAHYLSDVVAGAVIGLVAVRLALRAAGARAGPPERADRGAAPV